MYFFALIFLTFSVLGCGMWYAYRTTRDPLHPLMYMAPLCIYAYVYKPVAFTFLGVLAPFFDLNDLVYVQTINLLGVTAFCIGAAWHAHDVELVRRTPQEVLRQLQSLLTPGVRQRAADMAYVLGGISLAAYWSMTLYVGGLSAVYGQAKGGLVTSSGYLGEAPMFALPAIGLLFFAWAGQRFTPGRIALLLIFASPLIVHGLLGARRGPTFMIMAALLVGGYAVSQKRPKLVTVFVSVLLLGTLLLFLINNRNRIYLGSDMLAQWSVPSESPNENTIDSGEDYIFSSGLILTSRHTGTHFWGLRYLVNTVVRPIPRQFWPNKYTDTGFGWLDDQSDMEGMTDNDWSAAVGWLPVRGAAAGFIADFYLEFSYLGLAGCFFMGWFYSYLWRGMVVRGGIWAILYLYAAVLSIYVPTQNVTGAWLYRLLLFSVPTIAAWRWYISPAASSAIAAPAAPSNASCAAATGINGVSASRPRVAVAQIGARMHYAVPALLHREGMLEVFYTDLCAEVGWLRAASAILPGGIVPGSVRRLFSRRVPDVPREKIRCFSGYGLRRILKRGKVKTPGEMFIHLVDANAGFARRVARSGLGNANVLYAFNGAALEIMESARTRGVRTVLEHISAPVGYDERLLAEERQRWPGWEFDGAAQQDWQPMANREKREWELADTIVCGSEYVVQAMRADGGPVEKCVVVPYGVDAEQYRLRHPRQRTAQLHVVCVATLQLRKGVQYLIELARLLKGQPIDVRLVGPAHISDEELNRLKSAVTVVGALPREQVRLEYAQADVFLLPSISEGSATVCYEALASGLPVVTTTNAGSVVRDGVDGFVVPIRDPAALADRISLLCRDRQRLEEMSWQATQTAEQYTWNCYGKRLVEVITGAMKA